MEDVHRDMIQSNYASLVEQTDLDLMVSALYEKGVFSDHMIERYKDLRHDVRHRKRQLYMDVMTRGPDAFRHLIDALTEAGYWDLARYLDPDSHLHANSFGNRRPQTTSNYDDFISIRDERNRTNYSPETQTTEQMPAPNAVDRDNNPLGGAERGAGPAAETAPDPLSDSVDQIPCFNIKKCTRFVEDDDNGRGIKVYRTRGRPRGVLMVFSYTSYENNIELPRPGVEVDNKCLKYLFTELGFKVLLFNNLTKATLVSTLMSLNEVLAGVECVFIVVSSHGYGRGGSSDNDFRCYDGRLMSVYEFLDYFNNRNLSVLQGVPKVFIFQICRGATMDLSEMPLPMPEADADVGVFADARPPRLPPPADTRHRTYSDMLIAHSTLPGYVSWRDKTDGSWYIQALCHVFAEHAHDSHVEELFTLVDKRLAARYPTQTSSVDRWGFNCRLYLHPGLYEPAAAAASATDHLTRRSVHV